MPRSDLRSARRYLYTSSAASTPPVLKTAVMNGYLDNSKDTWIRGGVTADNSNDAEIHLGLCNPFLLNPAAAANFLDCLQSGCTCPPPPDGAEWQWDSINYNETADKCECIHTEGSGPFQTIYKADAINCGTVPPPEPVYLRAPTRSLLFFRMIDGTLAYDSNAEVNSRLPSGLDPSKIQSAKLVLTVKTNNQWCGSPLAD